MLSEAISLEAICTNGGIYSSFPWALWKIQGKDRISFLQGQVTSDVQALSEGEAQLSARIDFKGRLKSYFYLYKKANELLMLIPQELAEGTIKDLEQFVIMEEVTFHRLSSDGLGLCVGPLSLQAQKYLASPENFIIPFYDGPALVLLHQEDGEKLKKYFSLAEVSSAQMEKLRLLSGFPLWGKDVNAETLISETYLDPMTVSYSKGCFVGQETVAKIRTYRGASYYPALLKIKNIGLALLTYLEQLPPRSIFKVENRKGGIIHEVIEEDGELYLRVDLFREFRVEHKVLSVEIIFRHGLDSLHQDEDKDHDEAEMETIELKAEVIYLPYYGGHDALSKSQWLYDLALKRYTHLNETQSPVHLLKLAISLNPGFEDAYESLGVILGQLQRYEEAIQVMKQLSALNPRLVMPHTNMSLFYMKMGNIEAAEEEKSVATVKTFENLTPSANKTSSLENKISQLEEERQKREKMFHEVLAIDPEDSLANFGLAELHAERKEWQQAIGLYQKVLQADAKYSVAYLGLGKALEEIKDFDQAKMIYTKGIEVAAKAGALMPANEMQSRLGQIS